MLVTRQFDTEPSHWSSKFETALHKPTSSRMSSYDGSLSTQPEWQGHYSFLPPGENNIFAQPFEQVTGTSNNNETQSQQRSSARNNSLGTPSQASQSTGNSPISHQRPLDPLGLRQPKAETPTQEQSDMQGTAYAIKAESAHDEVLSSAETPGMSLESNPIGSVSSAGQGQDIMSSASGNEEGSLSKEDDDEILEDDEMMEGDGETSAQPQTAAERTAARRKMKRFRLTHQQTRFLMSEFAKQPHPDAAHRERLSREIPGLSPRQVQVWFQNRRAKIKRLTADDRDRMIKMRAVPDDFDNVQALHSPYGAVHALSTPITPPVDFNSSSYADHMIRPLMVDPMRRGDGDDHISPTGLSSAFGGIGFTPTTTISNPDILSPLSPSSSDRSYFSSHLTSPLGGAPRTSNPFARQNSLDTASQMHSQSRHQIRPLQPLQLRETMSRSRSDNLQSPLRSSMSWKGDSIDYATYSSSSGSPAIGGRHQSVYQPDQMGSSSGSGLGYESGSYSSPGVQSSTSNINYSSLQQSSQNRSRLRAATATLPLGLDLRHQYRPASNSHGLQSPAHTSTPRTPSTTSYGSSSIYTSSFPSAPLSAPIDFALSRTSGIRNSVPDYSMPQLSAPIAPSQDFSQALHGNMGNSNTRTPMRDTFGGGPLGISQGQGSGERNEDYSQEALGGSNSDLKHKRSSFSLPQGRHTPGPIPTSSQPYGHTT
ncbi:hypothetical protein F4809DRAFT_419876 [Biscogniauxia mediterranea]|nr:hypothetical protein F4809DRAFT_419876 [Biscogniauxia mediterranea]